LMFSCRSIRDVLGAMSCFGSKGRVTPTTQFGGGSPLFRRGFEIEGGDRDPRLHVPDRRRGRHNRGAIPHGAWRGHTGRAVWNHHKTGQGVRDSNPQLPSLHSGVQCEGTLRMHRTGMNETRPIVSVIQRNLPLCQWIAEVSDPLAENMIWPLRVRIPSIATGS
jgi:hypothetical protein